MSESANMNEDSKVRVAAYRTVSSQIGGKWLRVAFERAEISERSIDAEGLVSVRCGVFDEVPVCQMP
jgi:hypothetical protein